ncbi:phage holin family protein [Desulfovermiculus halophilus]|jgi:putative membrane protein|uniref:phage holin family protein n=1 Tax=Desulfovermiculus halophilus TaxID=339722 RepID=UPI0004888283|nr:phage holin family protein [Desulfovermiculus halophilus]
MNGIFIRWLALTAAILICAYLIDGIQLSSFFSALGAAAFLGILNALFRPVLILVTLPINILTLGLFTFVINAVLLLMVSGVVPGLEVSSFWSALGGALIISLISWLLSSFISDKGKVEYIELKKRGERWE